VVSKETDSPISGAERRRYERVQRRLGVTFTLEGRELAAHTVDISKTGALFASDATPSVGTQLLLNLSDRQNPDLVLYLKARVVREEVGEGNQPLFAVEFGDAIARDPRRLRMFLDRVLGIATGLIRVVGGDDGAEKAYAFSFESIHREGEERIKALQASLFSSVDEMEEADAILAGFGKAPAAEGIEGSTPTTKAAVEVPAPEPPPPAEEPPKKKEGKKKVAEPPPPPPPAPPAPEVTEEALLDEARPVTAELPEKPRREKPSLLKRLFGGKEKPKAKGGAGKGETLIQTQRLPTIVANDTDLPVVYRIGTNRYQAMATRVYCAGIKCRTAQQLPQLYATINILIPLAGARKISQIELFGDVTRVRSDEENSETGGIFEVRLSMRTDKMHLELYRVLLERLTGEKS
jgi:outer membrane biosynthesis protein TonB